MADMTLKMLLLGKDVSASKALKGVGTEADKAAGKHKNWGVTAGLAGGAAGLAVVDFAKDSIKAYSEAQEGQKRLQDAFQRFPALADTNQAALQGLNTALQKKTKYDDDNIASGQAVLAQFGVTGQQLKDTTPLLLDYASKTGKDIPGAAQDVGKALLGNAKALKNIGIKYKATGDTQKDYTNITALMRAQVGGFAEKEGTTAAGQAAILANQFGEIQETVGSKLVPVLMTLAKVLLSVIGFIGRHATVIKLLVGGLLIAVAAAKLFNIAQGIAAVASGEVAASTALQTISLGALKVAQAISTAAQWAFNAAMTANPIGLVIAAIALLVVGFIIAWKHSETFRNIVKGALHAVVVAAQKVGDWFKKIGGWIKDALKGIGRSITKPFTDAFAIIMIGIHAIETAFNAVKDALGGGGPSLKSLPQSPANRVGLKGHAAGGIFTGRTVFGNDMFGEAGPEAVIPLASGRGRSMLGGGGDTYNFTINTPDSIGAWKAVEKGLLSLKRNNQGRKLAFES